MKNVDHNNEAWSFWNTLVQVSYRFPKIHFWFRVVLAPANRPQCGGGGGRVLAHRPPLLPTQPTHLDAHQLIVLQERTSTA